MSAHRIDVRRIGVITTENTLLMELEFEPAAAKGELKLEAFLPAMFLTREEVEAVRDFLTEYLRIV